MKEDTERTPLRTILTNFLNHIDTLENQRNPEKSYEAEFQELKLFSESIKGTKQYSCSEGEKEVNRKKNRYKDILPFDLSRVVLNEYAGVPGSDYINANYIRGASGSPAYIASQGPLPNTVNDFWRMVVQCEVQVIVMACNEEEAGKHKCENYWVEGEGEEKQFGMVSLRLIKASTVCPDFSVRTMRLKYTNTQSNTEERTVCQFHYSAWPDHGVPPLVRPLLDMVRLVRDTQASETLPVLIHCSAGCGRTGTICAIDYVWGLLRAGKLTKDFSLLTLVREMRRQRIAMVQTKEQYVLVHQAVRELFREQLRMIDSHPYENIDSNGLPLIKCASPEPTYDTISSFQNNKSEEKQDEKEKEQAPPLPQKKRLQTLSSKQAKEVENQSERQRLVEQASSSGSRPRIATLRSLFERQHITRDTRQVSRSHSLGSARHPKTSTTPSAVEVAPEKPTPKPIPGKGILRVPQPQQTKPALPVKRSKSLRVLGSGDRNKLSVPTLPPETSETDAPRRLSLESNLDEIKDLVSESTHPTLTDCLSVDSIVAGLGVRERRNSFRQAVRREDHESKKHWSKKPGLLRSYTSVDMRSAREKPVLDLDTTSSKPLLRPKPNLQLYSNGKTRNLSVDPRSSFQNHPHSSPSVNQPCFTPDELKKLQSQASSSRTLMTHSTSLRLAPKSRREDCRVLLSPTMPRPDLYHYYEQIHSSGESTVSASSDQSISNKHLKPNTSRPKIQASTSAQKSDSDGSDKQLSRVMHHNPNINTPRRQDKPNPSSKKGGVSTVSGPPREQSNSIQSPNLRQEQKVKLYESVKSSEPKRTPPIPETRPVVYESRGVRQNSSGIYGTVSKVPPPPYIEPGKNAQKPVSSQHSHQPSNGIYYEDIYNRSLLLRHIPSSRDMVLPSHKPNSLGIDTRPSVGDSPGVMYQKNLGERKHPEHEYRITNSDIYGERQTERKPAPQEHKVPHHDPQIMHGNERRYQTNDNQPRNERQHSDHRGLLEKSSQDRHYLEQTPRTNVPGPYADRRLSDQSYQMPQDKIPSAYDQDGKVVQQDQYYRSLPEKRLVSQEYRRSPQESFSKPGDRRSSDQEIITTPESGLSSVNEKRFQNQEHQSSHHDQYSKVGTNYHPNSQELYSQLPQDRRSDKKPSYINSRPSRPHDQTPRSSRPSSDAASDDRPVNEVETAVSQGVKMRRGSRDDLALCGSTPSRVKRHASVVLLRHSLIQDSSNPTSPLSVWAQATGDQTGSQTPKEDPWSGSVGVDVDQVAASITSKKDDKMMRAALEALHLRKASQSTPKSTPTSHKAAQSKSLQHSQKTPKVGNLTPKASQNTPKQNHLSASGGEGNSKPVGSPPQYQPPPEAKPGPFRKQQQYL
ncbi:uncharacterized protein LOC128998066 isoform X2 [Macrosteles quadrilineatus]|uniref:uncharacterized protein LOC128998066 isoform X2 n=1 Tax=Macrosteles quadrilineatus TaxID=74068 RepID=UPI0023E0E3E5|nr:uncharacterized protein LOC128998066 isoform X2 [Macrosteles quadrilineatus]